MTVSKMKLRHAQRDVATALELALAALAPGSLIESLACAAGLLNALIDLPLDSEPMRAWAAGTIERAEHSLHGWRAWAAERNPTA